jgi:AcrR family transcriptional regulator
MATVNSYTDDMPTPDRTSLEEIVRAGCDLLESDGVAGLSMQAVADRVGVRAPSLYKRVRSRDDLIRLIGEATLADLAARLDAVAEAEPSVDPVERLTRLAHAVRAFARASPAAYRLVFSPPSADAAASPESITRSATAVLAVAADLAGPDDALAAARTVTAWTTGFIGMELAGAFRLGGDVDQAYAYGIARIAAALDRRADGSPADGSLAD